MKERTLTFCILLLIIVLHLISTVVYATGYKISPEFKGDIPTNVENGKDILSKLIIPMILAVVTGIISAININYLNSKEVNKYFKILKINSPHIKTFFEIKRNFEIVSHVLSIYILLFGFILGLATLPLVMLTFLISLEIFLGAQSITIFFPAFLYLLSAINENFISFVWSPFLNVSILFF